VASSNNEELVSRDKIQSRNGAISIKNYPIGRGAQESIRRGKSDSFKRVEEGYIKRARMVEREKKGGGREKLWLGKRRTEGLPRKE